jgi:hypothetical protein
MSHFVDPYVDYMSRVTNMYCVLTELGWHTGHTGCPAAVEHTSVGITGRWASSGAAARAGRLRGGAPRGRAAPHRRSGSAAWLGVAP